MEKHKELQGMLNELVNHITKHYVPGWSREQAVSKLHEMAWWLEKADTDQALAKQQKDPAAAAG